MNNKLIHIKHWPRDATLHHMIVHSYDSTKGHTWNYELYFSIMNFVRTNLLERSVTMGWRDLPIITSTMSSAISQHKLFDKHNQSSVNTKGEHYKTDELPIANIKWQHRRRLRLQVINLALQLDRNTRFSDNHYQDKTNNIWQIRQIKVQFLSDNV